MIRAIGPAAAGAAGGTLRGEGGILLLGALPLLRGDVCCGEDELRQRGGAARAPSVGRRARRASRPREATYGRRQLHEHVPMTLWVRVLCPEAPQLATVCL